MTGNNKIIAVCGKGGVGKTSISAAIVRILAESGDHSVLAIDGDPAIGLSTALGFQVTTTIDDIRNRLIEHIESGTNQDKEQTVRLLDYQVFEALEERGNTAFLAIGRPENKGCYCKVNGVLKDVIATVAKSFDWVVIDGEAGIEQVNRRVMEEVTHLILVSDPSAKGIHVAETIEKVARQAVRFEKSGLIVNRIHGEDEIHQVKIPDSLELLGWIPEDERIRLLDIKGGSVMELPEAGMMSAARTCLSKIGIIP